MLDINDFSKKQIIIYMPHAGDKLSYKNDNVIIKNQEGKIKYQATCYRIFMVMIVGDVTVTTGLLRKAKKYGFSILFLSYSFRLYGHFNAGIEGNTLLHKKQYQYEGQELGKRIIYNKIYNQRKNLIRVRYKTEFVSEGVELLEQYLEQLQQESLTLSQILSIEGNASRVYFARFFTNVNWKGRKPRVKQDYVNTLMDIGYTVLFHFIDSILHVFGFDVYQGVLHTCFYMRKSLVCDIMEVFRPIIDWKIRKGINLNQFKKEDFIEVKGQWQLHYKQSAVYTNYFLEELMNYKEQIFLYIRSYYRGFMKGVPAESYPLFDISEERLIVESEY